MSPLPLELFPHDQMAQQVSKLQGILGHTPRHTPQGHQQTSHEMQQRQATPQTPFQGQQHHAAARQSPQKVNPQRNGRILTQRELGQVFQLAQQDKMPVLAPSHQEQFHAFLDTIYAQHPAVQQQMAGGPNQVSSLQSQTELPQNQMMNHQNQIPPQQRGHVQQQWPVQDARMGSSAGQQAHSIPRQGGKKRKQFSDTDDFDESSTFQGGSRKRQHMMPALQNDQSGSPNIPQMNTSPVPFSSSFVPSSSPEHERLGPGGNGLEIGNSGIPIGQAYAMRTEGQPTGIKAFDQGEDQYRFFGTDMTQARSMTPINAMQPMQPLGSMPSGSMMDSICSNNSNGPKVPNDLNGSHIG
ncbi:hypothetical protein K504DRAFT_467932 [Pleomassaria siparia CBS 279.74]|uniref:Uncharacterized protein n=1 Tax=Pleomassaria siparia CBS 279.74 TaxID=1314801 RepID=A0A6G1K731_9PLEO|nr:hypothetical protein K504DRAFT_467932 [Pleomassaria siparia CBS 279.74]